VIKLADILLEIGDASIAPAPYTVAVNKPYDLKIEFTVEDVSYFLRIESRSQILDKTDTIRVDFGVAGTETHQWLKDTNKGDQYKIMATVVRALKDFADSHPNLDTIVYTPVKTKGPQDRGREILYKAYVNKQIPDWSYHTLDDTVVLRKPKD
jgi:hypothetical protein